MTSKMDVEERIEYIVNFNAALLARCGYSADAYCRVVLNAMVQTPQIAECNPDSLQQALLAAMNAGLVPDGKEAVIVPYHNRKAGKLEAQLIPCVKGMIKLVQQAKPGTVLRVMAVFAGDEWEYTEGLHPKLNHVPSPTASQAPEEVIYAYATARLPGAIEPMYDVMSRGEIDRYRAYSKSPAWNTHFVEQSKNPVLRRLLKRLPMSGLALDVPQELEHVDTLEDAAALYDGNVDMTTGEIMEVGGPVQQPPPNGRRASKPEPLPEPTPEPEPEPVPAVDSSSDDDEAPF